MASQADVISNGAERREKRLSVVAHLKRGLPIAAGLLVILCIIQVAFRSLAAEPEPTTPTQASAMIGPHFSGQSADGRAFRITGERGVRDPKVEGRILITAPVLSLRNPNGVTQTATARDGIYDEPAHTLILTGDVRMDNGAGARFSAERAAIDTRTGSVSGQSGLRIDSGETQIQSGDYSVEEKGDRLIMKGGVRGRFTPQN
ncbi:MULTISPECIES: LPS export ABC transporter periplasmic protein LptC [Phenylobacterium]|uniref:Lipopolysaccharide export system protein LptC n=1 Tax=Phenylobacterium koreense TaxID=266125 RepID=A0ABV2EDW8_9CAUL